MPNIQDRPYVGTWKLNQRPTVKYTPDALVYINGDTSVPGCGTCNGRIDLQPFVKGISVETSTLPGGHSASIQLNVPRVYGQSLFVDGKFLIRPTLEVHIYVKGWFPITGMYDQLGEEETTIPRADQLGGSSEGANSIEGLPAYPYYHVFHGVITQVNHDYSDGFYTATLACGSMLHFWQFQTVSVNGAAFGTRPRNSKVKLSMIGHNMSGMTPYGIIYSLYKDTAGAVQGVNFALNDKTNNSAVTSGGDTLYTMSMLYWERRFKQSMYSLRMHGTSGRLFNGAQQAFLGSVRTQDVKNILKGSMYSDGSKLNVSRDLFGDYLTVRNKLRESGKTDEEISKSIQGRRVSNTTLGNLIGANTLGKDVIFSESASGKEMGLSVLDAQAFVSDVSNWGNISLWETEYETKLDIAHKVTQITGFEFFQDVDGDFVFKPPFYNLDISGNRVYTIEDIDIINFNSMEKEPMATMVTLKGAQYKNLVGLGLDGAWGKRGQYIDYRLVAQYGWRPHTMDVTYFNNPRSLFYAAVNLLDLLNIDVNSATLTIPIRPELRPGYPIYISSIDSFYYVTAFSHSFQFGGQCTTTLTLTARRSKFYAPGEKPDGEAATVDSIKLDNPYLPPTPLIFKGNDGLPRLTGFPNVVMALDPTRLNPKYSVPNLVTLDNISDDSIPAVVELIKAIFQSGSQIIGVCDQVPDSKKSMDEGPFCFKLDGHDEIIVDFLSDSAAFSENFHQAFEQVKKLKKEKAEIERNLSSRKERRGKKARQSLERSIDDLRGQLETIFDSQDNALSLVVLYQRNLLRNNDPEGRSNLTGVKDASSTAAYLDVLEDRKSSFVSDSFPGYYRYYSASHPEPTYQGMSLMVEADPTETESAITPAKDTKGARVKTPGTVLGPKPDGDVPSEDNFSASRTGFQKVTVTHGIALSSARGSGTQVTPTNLIQTIAFTPILVRKAVSTLALKLVDNFNLSDKGFRSLTGFLADRIVSIALEGKSVNDILDETIQDTIVSAAKRINFITLEVMKEENAKELPEINRAKFRAIDDSGIETQDQIKLGFPSNYFETTPDIDLPVGTNKRGGSPRGVLTDSDTAVSLENGIFQGERLSKITIEEAFELVKKSSDKRLAGNSFRTFGKHKKKIKGEEKRRFDRKGTFRNIARHYANYIVGAKGGNQPNSIRYELDRVMQIVVEEDKKNISHFFNELLFGLTEAPLEYVTKGKGAGNLQKDDKLAKRMKKLTTRPTPVFPISDAQGYEVIGSYRYGRGIGVGVGGTMQAIYESGDNLILDLFDNVDAKTVHDFLDALSTFEVHEGAHDNLEKNPEYNKFIEASNNTSLSSDERSQARSQANTLARRALAGAAIEKVAETNPGILVDFKPSGTSGVEPLEGFNLSPSQNAWTNHFANSVVTGNEQNFKLPVVNNSHLINDIQKDMAVNQRGMCSCRAAEADIQLEAFGKTKFLSLEGESFDDASVKFMQEQMIEKSIVWRDNRKAMGGTKYEDPFEGIIDAWNRLKDAGQKTKDGFRAGDRFRAQVGASAVDVQNSFNTLFGRASE